MPKDIQFILYNLLEKEGRVQVIIRNETLWYTKKQWFNLLAWVVIPKHLKNIFGSTELQQNSVCKILHILSKMIKYICANLF